MASSLRKAARLPEVPAEAGASGAGSMSCMLAAASSTEYDVTESAPEAGEAAVDAPATYGVGASESAGGPGPTAAAGAATEAVAGGAWPAASVVYCAPSAASPLTSCPYALSEADTPAGAASAPVAGAAARAGAEVSESGRPASADADMYCAAAAGSAIMPEPPVPVSENRLRPPLFSGRGALSSCSSSWTRGMLCRMTGAVLDRNGTLSCAGARKGAGARSGAARGCAELAGAAAAGMAASPAGEALGAWNTCTVLPSTRFSVFATAIPVPSSAGPPAWPLLLLPVSWAVLLSILRRRLCPFSELLCVGLAFDSGPCSA